MIQAQRGQGEGPVEHAYRRAQRIEQVHSLLHEPGHLVHDHLGIGIGTEFEAELTLLTTQVVVVLDDPVAHERHVGTDMWMGIALAGRPMGGPARMGNTRCAGQWMRLEAFFQFSHLARSWFQLQELEKEKTSAELKALKSQLNPHFLFNSLNSIYSLARKNSSLVPEKIVQLSDLMRHIIYESDVEFIPLEKEVEMVKNYIELQNLRSVEQDRIKMEIKGEIKGKIIAPLLFLPFVENSFKHGLRGGKNNSYVRIKIETTGQSLFFSIKNNKGENVEIADSKYKGIGIENVKKRLELIYSGKHSLEISDVEDKFEVNLQIQLS